MPGSIQGLQHWWGGRPVGLRLAAEAALGAAVGAATAALPRIPQPDSYHSFAGDHRSFLGEPHAANVLSNAAMAVPGATGLWMLLAERRRLLRRISTSEALCWASTFLCMLGAAVGSARYHLEPNNATLAWDRLGMALTFASLNAAVVAERRRHAAGLLALLPLQLAAAASVAAWQRSEAEGRGDLRPYLLMQGLAVASLAYNVVCYPSPRGTTPRLLRTLGLYALAIAGDRLDRPVCWLTLSTVSGHTLKHLLAGAAGWQLVRLMHDMLRV